MSKSKKRSELFNLIKDKALCFSDETEEIIRHKDGTKCGWLFDMRRLFVTTKDLDLITEVFWDEMEEAWPFQVGGLEVGAIPLVAGILMKGKMRGYDVNGFIVRKSRKKAGLCKQIEGTLTDDPIVVVDDLINSGGSIGRVVAAVEQEKKKVSRVFVFVDFQRKGVDKYLKKELKVKLKALFNLDDFGLCLGGNEPIFPTEPTLVTRWIYEPPYPNFAIIIPRSNPIFDDKNIYYGADNGYFYAINQKTGKKVWERQTGESIKGIFSSPAIYGDGVIFGAYDGTVYNLDRKTGKSIWEFSEADYVGSSPAIAEDLGLAFVGLEHNVYDNQGSLVALDLETGEKVWEFFLRHYLHGTPAYCPEKKLVVVGTNDKTALCFNARNGDFQWEFQMEGESKASVAFDVKRNQVIVPSFDWHIYGIDLDSGEENFRYKTNYALYSTPTVIKDRVYIGGCDKHLYIYDLQKNELVKRVKTIGRILSQPNLIGDTIFFGSNDGCVREIDLEGTLLGGLYLPERVVTKIVYNPKTQFFHAVLAGNILIALQREKDFQKESKKAKATKAKTKK